MDLGGFGGGFVTGWKAGSESLVDDAKREALGVSSENARQSGLRARQADARARADEADSADMRAFQAGRDALKGDSAPVQTGRTSDASPTPYTPVAGDYPADTGRGLPVAGNAASAPAPNRMAVGGPPQSDVPVSTAPAPGLGADAAPAPVRTAALPTGVVNDANAEVTGKSVPTQEAAPTKTAQAAPKATPSDERNEAIQFVDKARQDLASAKEYFSQRKSKAAEKWVKEAESRLESAVERVDKFKNTASERSLRYSQADLAKASAENLRQGVTEKVFEQHVKEMRFNSQAATAIANQWVTGNVNPNTSLLDPSVKEQTRQLITSMENFHKASPDGRHAVVTETKDGIRVQMYRSADNTLVDDSVIKTVGQAQAVVQMSHRMAEGDKAANLWAAARAEDTLRSLKDLNDSTMKATAQKANTDAQTAASKSATGLQVEQDTAELNRQMAVNNAETAASQAQVGKDVQIATAKNQGDIAKAKSDTDAVHARNLSDFTAQYSDMLKTVKPKDLLNPEVVAKVKDLAAKGAALAPSVFVKPGGERTVTDPTTGKTTTIKPQINQIEEWYKLMAPSKTANVNNADGTVSKMPIGVATRNSLMDKKFMDEMSRVPPEGKAAFAAQHLKNFGFQQETAEYYGEQLAGAARARSQLGAVRNADPSRAGLPVTGQPAAPVATQETRDRLTGPGLRWNSGGKWYEPALRRND